MEMFTTPEQRLAQAIAAAQQCSGGGIGRLSEKTLHSVLKYYFEPDDSRHEIPIAGYYADIANADGITEIQTASFGSLRNKLDVFLPSWPVNVVHPIPYQRWLHWVNPQSGEISEGRKSPKKGSLYEIVKELVFIKPYLLHPHLTITAVLLDMDEYKLLDGFGASNKIRASRQERLPRRFIESYVLGGAQGYQALLPAGLPQPFSTREFAKAAGLPPRLASAAVNVLKNTGTIRQTGKSGNLLLYTLEDFSFTPLP